MRVAHLIHGLGLGGAQQVIKFIVQERRPDEFEHLVYSCHGGVFQEQIEAVGAQVRILPRRIPKLDPFWVRSMAKAMVDDRVDVVHGHLFGDSLHGYLAAKRAKRLPMVLTLHNSTDARTGLQLRGYKWLLQRDTVAIACAEFVRTSFVDSMGSAAQGVRTISNGIAFDDQGPRAERAEVTELGLRPEAVIFATIGRLEAQKAYPMLFRALRELIDRTKTDLQVVMFGDGSLRAELEQLRNALGLQDHLKMAGFRKDITRWLPAVDAVVFSSIFEGLPIALLEAMATRRAVVATRVGGMPGALEADRDALLVPARDPEALSEAMARIVEQPELRRRLGESARARFEAEFTAQTMTRRYEDLYREVAGSRL